jgi:predicted dehydrogenase
LESGKIGTPFRARIDMISGFPLFENQPFLKDLEQYILTDLGSHILDVARFLFGEAQTFTATRSAFIPTSKAKTWPTVMMKMSGDTTVVCEMAYAENYLERDVFPKRSFSSKAMKVLSNWRPITGFASPPKDGTHSPTLRAAALRMGRPGLRYRARQHRAVQR